MSKPTYDELKEKYDDLIDKQVQNNFIIEELSNRIYSTIDYIYKNTYFSEYTGKRFEIEESFDVDILHKILRGEK